MASIRKLKSGKWQAQIYKNGLRTSKTFHSKLEAKDWAARAEVELIKQSDTVLGDLGDLLARYGTEVSPRKKGAKWEILRLKLIGRDPVSKVPLSDISAQDLASWRDRRLLCVSKGTVTREMQLLSHAFNIAVDEWGWLKTNPIRKVKKPGVNPPRDRLIGTDEIDRLIQVANYDRVLVPATVSQKVVHVFLFAIETAMRAGEIVGLTRGFVDIEKRTAKLAATKNGDRREVPLSKEAVRLLKLAPNGETIFDINSAQLDAMFRKLKSKADIHDLHFHDTRHEAITRLAKKLDVLALARMVGHRNIGMLQVYYNETAEQLAKRLD